MNNIKNSSEVSVLLNELLKASMGINTMIESSANNSKHDWIKKAIVSFIAKTDLANSDPISQGFLVKPSILQECNSKKHFKMQLQLERAANSNVGKEYSVKGNASRVSQRRNSAATVKAK